jgi:nitroreductase
MKKLAECARTVKGLLALARENRLAWLIYFAQYRSRYGLHALQSGVQMNRNGSGDLYNFRRNIHRIEKGLISKRPRSVFAEDYILETVDYLAQLRSLPVTDNNTVAWGESVLGQYFKVCERTDKIAEAYAVYRRLNPMNGSPEWLPYPGGNRQGLAVEYEALHRLALRRRSVRHYLPKTVELDVVMKAMEVAVLSPSACNRQAFRFLFYNDREMVRKISHIPGGFVGYEAPSIVVVVGSYRGYFDERDVNVPIIDASLAVMSFVFALVTLGLDSVCMNWPALPDRDESVRQLIHLEDDEFIIMLIGVGYADPEGKIPYSAKRNLDRILFCDPV